MSLGVAPEVPAPVEIAWSTWEAVTGRKRPLNWLEMPRPGPPNVRALQLRTISNESSSQPQTKKFIPRKESEHLESSRPAFLDSKATFKYKRPEKKVFASKPSPFGSPEFAIEVAARSRYGATRDTIVATPNPFSNQVVSNPQYRPGALYSPQESKH